MSDEAESQPAELPPLVQGPITIDPADPVVAEILSKPCFVCGPIAHVLQLGGYPIEKRAESEQSAVLLWLLSLYRDYGADWRTKGQEFLNAIKVKAR